MVKAMGKGKFRSHPQFGNPLTNFDETRILELHPEDYLKQNLIVNNRYLPCSKNTETFPCRYSDFNTAAIQWYWVLAARHWWIRKLEVHWMIYNATSCLSPVMYKERME